MSLTLAKESCESSFKISWDVTICVSYLLIGCIQRRLINDNTLQVFDRTLLTLDHLLAVSHHLETVTDVLLALRHLLLQLHQHGRLTVHQLLSGLCRLLAP